MAETDCAKAEEIENFYGVYLLVSQNVRYKGRTYVGFTVDPIRRLKQHNGGMSAIIQIYGIIVFIRLWLYYSSIKRSIH